LYENVEPLTATRWNTFLSRQEVAVLCRIQVV